MVTVKSEIFTFVRSILKLSVWLSILAGLSLLILLPHVVAPITEKLILQKTASIRGLEHLGLNIETIGLSGIGIGNITTGESVSVDSIFCRYSPLSLMHKSINRLDISGLEIRGVIDGSAPVLADFSTMSDSFAESDSGRQDQDGLMRQIALIVPFLPPEIEISHSFLTLKHHDSLISIPFSLVCRVDNKNSSIKLLLTLMPLGQKINIALDADVRNSGDSSNLPLLKKLFSSVMVSANNVSWSPVNELISIVAPESDVKLTGRSDITLAMGGDLSKWNLNLSHVGIRSPFQGEINNVVLNLTLNDFEQLLRPSPEPTGEHPAVSVEGSFWFGNSMISPLNAVYALTVNRDRKWALSLKGRELWEQKAFTIGAGEELIKINAPDFELECSGDELSAAGELTATMGRVISENHEISLERVKFQLPFRYGENIKGGAQKSTRRDRLKGVLNVDEIQYNGRKIASLKSTVLPISAGTGETKKGGNDTGALFEGQIVVDGVATVPVRSKVALVKDKGLEASLSYQLKPTAVTPDLFRRIYLPSDSQKNSSGAKILSGMDFGFKMASRGEFSFHDNQMESQLSLDLSGGILSIPEKKINISGIRTSLLFNDLPAIRSVAGQVLTVEKIEIKDLKISDAQIRYTIESNKEAQSGKVKFKYVPALLIESASFNWCDGKVISESMRLSPSERDYDMSLFCDRLKLSSILKQVGSFDAEGEGTLNGRIPLSFSGGDITFDNGFLYSTPGQGGRIKVLGTEKLTAGIPVDTPQFAQVDLATEALKNYRYEWAKLGFNTQGDQLIVKMEFDGRPENVMPFAYKKELGSFVRVSGKSSGSNFQGIKIDLNLQLPFNRVLRFGNEMNSLFK